MPEETRPGECHKSYAKVNDSFATIANKIEMEAGIDDIPVAMHHVNLPNDYHAPFLIKQEIDKTPSPHPFKSNLFEVEANDYYPDHMHIFTDGLKNLDNGRVGFAVVEERISRHPKVVKYARLPDNLSEYTAELTAIKHALIWIKNNKYRQSVIFSDSLSSTQSIQGNQSNRPNIIAAIQTELK